MKSDKYIIGLVGHTGSGKDTLAKLLVEALPAGAKSISFSQVLREKILSPAGIEPTRENLQKVGIEINREEFARTVYDYIQEQPEDTCLLPGVRMEQDVELIRSFPRNLLIAITTDDQLCFERMKARNEKLGEATLTWEDFTELRRAPIELQIGELMKQADVTIHNDGTLEELKEKVAALMPSII
ncbi:MAG: AAA family ATPase [Patescibacteria group bacterium]